jgi:hypothetical protein
MLSDLSKWQRAARQAGAEASRLFHPDVVSAALEGVYRGATGRSEVP